MKVQLGPRAPRWVFLILCISTLFVGCFSRIRPLTTDELNEFPPQRQAAITLSDPQIYSRETLVNDRRKEAEYLNDLLEKSKTAVFEPQIRRDLRTLTATVLQLQAAYDPLAGRQAERSEGLAEIDNRIAETERLQKLAEARIKLIEAERRLDKLAEEQEQLRSVATADTAEGSTDAGSADGESSSTGGDAGASTGAQESSSEAKQEDLAKRAELLQADVEQIKSLIAALPSIEEVRSTALGATPREVFRDRQAYRGELRGALAEVELDDAHDQGQNSLYRLQFRATVLPGPHQDKMGVARLTLTPPELKRDDVLELYKTWLGHLTYRLNQTLGNDLHHDKSYLLLGMGLDRSLFHATRLPLRETGEQIYVALPPRIYAQWKDVTSKGLEGLESDLEDLRDRLRHSDTDGSKCLSKCAESQGITDLELLRKLSHIEPFMSASIRGLSDIDSIRLEVAEEIHQIMEKFVDASETLDRYRQCLEECNCAPPLGSSAGPQYEAVPQAFKTALVRACSSTEAICRNPTNKVEGIAHGGADVYATAPVEVAQQISTTLSAFRSFEVALSLAAALPTQGLGANAGFNRLSAMRSDIEARERLPQVVGFAERTPSKIIPGKEDPQFGWIFGPQASIDAQENRLRLRRPVVNLPVTADLSIPGWWPTVELKLETAWVANWHEGKILREIGGQAENVDATTFPVYLPLNRSDLDGLTEYLAKKTVGGALAYTSISAVIPETISTCADEVTFLVHGANLWRSSDAFLNGLKASGIRVLPDMGGLAVTFKGIRNGLPQIPKANGEAVLTVWTRNGASSRKVTVLDPKAAGLSCGPAKEPELKLAVGPRPLIPVDATKPEKSAQVRLQITQGKLPVSFAERRIRLRPAKPLAAGAMAEWSPLPEKDVSPDGDFLVGDGKWTFDAKPGEEVQVVLAEKPMPKAAEIQRPVEGTLVYYAAKKDAQIQVTETTIRDLAKDTVDLLFPYRYDLAFPHLKPGRVKLGVEVEGDLPKGYRISLRTPTPDKLPDAKAQDEASRKLSMHLERTEDKGAKEEDWKAFLATDPKLAVTLKVEGAEDWAVPEVVGKVTLGKTKSSG